jgi:hypothetical protein
MSENTVRVPYNYPYGSITDGDWGCSLCREPLTGCALCAGETIEIVRLPPLKKTKITTR